MKTITTTYNPETHKLVPVEPTPEMRAAALSQFTLPQIWDAMLAAAPQVAQREPLTDEEIDAIGLKLLGALYGGNTDRDFARAVERAHGIGGKA